MKDIRYVIDRESEKLDDLLDTIDASDEEHDRWEFKFYELKETVCSKIGHKVTDDQCGKPEHRYCVFCNASTPTAAVGQQYPGTGVTKEQYDALRELAAIGQEIENK